MALRTGIVVLTLLAEHMCRVLNTYRPAINALVTAAVGAGTITAAQATTIGTWLDGASAGCAILKTISGY